MMRVLVFGAGAMGSLIGGLLAQQHNVTFIGRSAHMTAIRKNGLKITGKTELSLPSKAILAYTDVEPLKKGCGPPELVLVTVKSYDTTGIISDLQKITGPETVLCSLQNGLDNEEKLRSAWEFAKMLTEVGIETTLTDDICVELWAKVAINASINPITAITGLKNGWLLREPNLTALLEGTCNEVIAVAEKSGAKLASGEDLSILERTKRVVERTADNKSSMLQDIEKGKRTEIDSINGAVVRTGERCKVHTPLNSTLTTLVKGRESKVLKSN
jgi:2-dehydropantoate 2-reductase